MTFLDGDEIRAHLSKGLGFSREDRDENVKRVGYVAGEVVKHGGIVIVAMIAPYHEARQYMRSRVEEYGTFIEIFVDTSIEECERRDTKGMYELARKGVIKEFTGVSDPYEVPERPELMLKTEAATPEVLIESIVQYLSAQKIIES